MEDGFRAALGINVVWLALRGWCLRGCRAGAHAIGSRYIGTGQQGRCKQNGDRQGAEMSQGEFVPVALPRGQRRQRP